MLTAWVPGEGNALPAEARITVHGTAHKQSSFREYSLIKAVVFNLRAPQGLEGGGGILPPLTASVTSQRNCNSLESARVKCRHVPRENLQ